VLGIAVDVDVVVALGWGEELLVPGSRFGELDGVPELLHPARRAQSIPIGKMAKVVAGKRRSEGAGWFIVR
jgi:hypothetical protein